ncbi:bifunctional proline dehydrogenase/L-glutamate gamma-semialdehyde dehydrogenase PutA [Candidatus Thioglobus sp.]|nr:bifunctional proline dehydrogenase/L-glutamate gamma-semialdehyde dehydrogenase PutA [Candidatus Thioglobus sp.]
MASNELFTDYSDLRQAVRNTRVLKERQALSNLIKIDKTSVNQRAVISQKTSDLIAKLRQTKKPDLLSQFIAEYNLNTEEGLSLMTLAESFLRVPDNKTRDKLFSDKISNKPWAKHLRSGKSSIVSIATIALSVADMMISHGHNDSIKDRIKHALEILSRPGIRFSAGSVMRFFGTQFVFSEDIESALAVVNQDVHSFDMLGEAAWTMTDADRYFLAYKNALIAIGENNKGSDIFLADGISVKLSALHPTYDFMHKERVLKELVPRLLTLIEIAQNYNVAINIDAEECDRLDISLDVIGETAKSIANSKWQGFGVVVQAYQKRAPYILDWLYELSKKNNLKLMVRLVKGAYWDSEIKQAQVLGDVDYPVFTKKSNTDYSFLACAQKLLGMRDYIYPQFASHNAHTLISVCEIAGDNVGFEIQRLHGMGESLHELLSSQYGVLSRIYAPVGSHKDLLAYLMRRLLENGANSSFINHLFDQNIKPEHLACDILSQVEQDPEPSHLSIPLPKDIFQKIRQNSRSILLSEQDEVDRLYQKQQPWLEHKWQAKSIISADCMDDTMRHKVINPADFSDKVGDVIYATETQLDECLKSSQDAFKETSNNQLILQSLERAADLYESNQEELMSLAMREAGKTYQDAIDEVREAVDFLRYYANLAQKVIPNKREALGVFVCISPWNFPLAIFTGQIAAALSAGNVVIAKPAESTSLIAYRATQLLLEAGIPLGILQLALGEGSNVGSHLASHPSIAGVAFTGSTQVAKLIKHNLVVNGNAKARVIAETGGLNAMVVDSTALSEQVTRDVLDSAFKSAGQRCSALRILLIQDECFDETISMIKGAMLELKLGDPKYLSTDCGPVISADAKTKLQSHIDRLSEQNKVIAGVKNQLGSGYYVAPTIIQLDSIDEINEEFFGPILHVIRYSSDNLIETIDRLNAKGYGLTFGIHSRIKKQVDEVTSRVNAGNIYVNRNQVGAIVGSQPFGGEGLSGTGPKAGGLHALHGYSRNVQYEKTSEQIMTLYDGHVEVASLIKPSLSFDEKLIKKLRQEFFSIDTQFFEFLHETLNTYALRHSLPSPTGESNELSYQAKGTVLCLGPSSADALIQTIMSLALGNSTISLISQKNYSSLIKLGFGKDNIIRLINGPSSNLFKSKQYGTIFYFGDLMSVERELENRREEIIPIMNSIYEPWQLINERVITIDTTASGGNANLLAL